MIEKKIIEDCKKGDLRNFRKLVEKTSPRIYSAAFRIIGDEESTRDIVQDTMVTIWQKIPKIKSVESYWTWVYRITVNKCYDYLRKMKLKPEFRPDDHTWSIISNHISQDEVTELENEENAMLIEILTNRLSPKQKTVFVLSELEEMSNDQIAQITGMFKPAVKANLYYARKKIENLLKKYL